MFCGMAKFNIFAFALKVEFNSGYYSACFRHAEAA